jgi:hypothetical protein
MVTFRPVPIPWYRVHQVKKIPSSDQVAKLNLPMDCHLMDWTPSSDQVPLDLGWSPFHQVKLMSGSTAKISQKVEQQQYNLPTSSVPTI